MALHRAGSSWVSDFSARQVFEGDWPRWPDSEMQSSSKLQQFRKWRAEIPDTPLGLTGIGSRNEEQLYKINI